VGYNLSATGKYLGGVDKPICTAGAFNKFIEKLQGIHPDCQTQFITKELATLKLPCVVREEARLYLNSLANSKTPTGHLEFTQLIARVKKEGVEVIWHQIKENVANRLFEEFGLLYREGKDDSAFIDLVSAGEYLNKEALGDLSTFQQQAPKVEELPSNYSQLLDKSGIFPPPPPQSEERLGENLSNSQPTQESTGKGPCL
jgi:hypothetical protein